MSFNPNDFATEYCTVEEVLEIKRAFDLFDRDLGGAIDPRGLILLIQNSKLLSTHSVLKQKPKLFIKWSLNLIRTVVVWSNLMNFSKWWLLDPHQTNQENKSTKFLLLLTTKKPDLLLLKTWEELQKIWENWLMTTPFKKWLKELILIKMDWSLKRNFTIF